MSRYYYLQNIVTGPPPITVPAPYLRFEVAGPGASQFTTVGSAVTSVTLAGGLHLLPTNSVTLIDAPELGAGVKAVRFGYYGYLELQSLLPEGFYADHDRTLFFLIRTAVGARRELASINPVQVQREAYDFVSLDNASHTDLGIGIHQIGNDGVLPALPAATAYTWRPVMVRYNRAAGTGSAGTGTQYIRDHVSSSEEYLGALKTGLTTRALPRLGLGCVALDGAAAFDMACARWWPQYLSDEQADIVFDTMAAQHNNVYSV